MISLCTRGMLSLVGVSSKLSSLVQTHQQLPPTVFFFFVLLLFHANDIHQDLHPRFILPLTDSLCIQSN